MRTTLVCWTRCVFVCTGFLAAPLATSGPGHGHGEGQVSSANPNTPRRNADGSVFLPKPAQHQIGVRTQKVGSAQFPLTRELAGTVVADPSSTGRVQSTQAGRIEATQAFPRVGQAVRKGQALVSVSASISAPDRAAQAATIADLQAQRVFAERRLSRAQALQDTVPRKEQEAARAEIDSIDARLTALRGGVAPRETLYAPVSGVISVVNAVAGQVVDAREVLFEIVDPNRTRIEVLSYDADLLGDIESATLRVQDRSVALQFVGAPKILRDQAQPLIFQGASNALAGLAIGQPVRLVVQRRTSLSGIALPSDSLVRNPSNQTIVWIKVEPENFVPKIVVHQPLDASRVVVTSGLSAGDRVVTRAATLLNQVR